MASPMTQWFSRLNRIRGTIWILKNLVMLVNVLALIASVGFFIAGIVGYNESNIVGIVSSSLPAACIGLGVVVALVSLVGCFGAANESPFFMRVYFGLLSAIVVSEIVVGGVAYSHKDNVEVYLTSFWTRAFDTDKTVVARIQRLLQCCGFRTVTEMAVVEACPVQTACYVRMRERFISGLHTMGSIALALGVIEMFCLMAAGLLVYFSQLSEDARNSELLEEARKLALVERERSKSAKYNFENPFDVGDDDE